MQDQDTLLVVGAGHAGAELALAARQAGWAGPIRLLGDEAELPYHRPPLSKAYLHGEASRESLLLRAQAAYEAARVQFEPGARVQALDTARRCVTLADGRELAYAELALCTGGRPRRLVVPGLAADDAPPNLHHLRTLADADGMRAQLRAGVRLVIVGGGYVGLELAASASKLGAQVTVLEAMPHVLARVTSERVAHFYEAVHREAGVAVLTGFGVARVERAPDGGDVRTAAITAIVGADGRAVPADVVVVGIGMLPNVELAQAAGLAVDGGIVVDEAGRSSAPHVWAAGDCTAQHSALYGRTLRLESVPNALEQARTVAAALAGKPMPARAAPWFWSDQFDLKLQMVGLSQGHDACVIRGDLARRQFIAFYLRAGVLIAADAVNRPGDFVLAKRLVAQAARVDAAQLVDESVALKSLALA
ncbi:pyridine nucleotide-disulfide oxidoreductase [Comamonas serinivorans]|uniref:Pyridine nucleotide-disulfide oxidoreductase n=1 Tax=Comamonas serinivorans TaxID=1082851 RepID=A0A1Y0EJD2_9BURK|nr:FAD-dependent oxidoreductase [Comamonas serinivorans]ARU03743.1 pyridine nucleotide-disulfide oxidoreductase [Comamonas serinivorans]